jgi:hypothetical protein
MSYCSYSSAGSAPTHPPKSYSTTLTTNPKTGTAWTWSDLENLEVGVSIDIPAATVYVSKIYAEVDYDHLTSVGIGPQLIGLTW